MPPSPLTAPFRIIFRYTVATFVHKKQFYLACNPSADPSGYDTVFRSGFGAVGVSTLADPFFTKLAPFYDPADASFDSWELLQRSGTTWVHIASGSPTVVPTGAVVHQNANQYCVSGKALGNRPINHYIYEGAFGTALKVNSIGGLVSAARSWVNYLFDPDGVAVNTSAFVWAISRDGWLMDRWLSAVVDTNEKLRRERRIK